MNIASLVDSLMSIANQQYTRMETKQTELSNQSDAITVLSALVASTEYIVDLLGTSNTSSPFSQEDATSSNTSVLTATANGSVATGTYSFTVLETAQSEQMLSSGFKSSSSTVGNGTVTLRFGDGVDNSVDVADLNGGEGITAGTFRITDRSGASAIIDVSGAQTIDDVLSAINNCGSINVTASTEDGHIVLTDNTGETSSNLKVQEIGKGTTAESLGLSGINVASSTADGSDIYYVTKDTALEYLNDGNGVALSTVPARHHLHAQGR